MRGGEEPRRTLERATPLRWIMLQLPHPFVATSVAMLALDFFFCRHCRVRWFLLHAWANVVVTVAALPDALLAADAPHTSCVGGASTFVPLWQIITLHVYHLAFFSCSVVRRAARESASLPPGILFLPTPTNRVCSGRLGPPPRLRHADRRRRAVL